MKNENKHGTSGLAVSENIYKIYYKLTLFFIISIYFTKNNRVTAINYHFFNIEILAYFIDTESIYHK